MLKQFDEIIFAIAMRLHIAVADLLEMSMDEVEVYYHGLLAQDRAEHRSRK